MKSHAVLNFDDHREVRVRTDYGAELGDGEMSCFVVPIEFRRLQNDYPILFQRNHETGGFSAIALFGFAPGENFYLDGNRWAARYRPMALAIQPLLIGRAPGGEGESQVHIDLDHPRIDRGGEGVRLFEETGMPSPYLDRAVALLGELDAGYQRSGDFFVALEKYGLIEPCVLDIPGPDGTTARLAGYHMIDENKLRQLDGAAIADLHAADHLVPIFMAMASLSNLAKLAECRAKRSSDG